MLFEPGGDLLRFAYDPADAFMSQSPKDKFSESVVITDYQGLATYFVFTYFHFYHNTLLHQNPAFFDKPLWVIIQIPTEQFDLVFGKFRPFTMWKFCYQSFIVFDGF